LTPTPGHIEAEIIENTNVHFGNPQSGDVQRQPYNIDIFDWNDIDFNRFTFNSLDGPVVVPMRKKAKKIQTFQLKVENARPNEPFGLLAIQINFKVGGLVKK
ncbi:MAG: hypothetical protein ACLVJ8_18410, partial [Ruthenibacterium lactatiformans]